MLEANYWSENSFIIKVDLWLVTIHLFNKENSNFKLWRVKLCSVLDALLPKGRWSFERHQDIKLPPPPTIPLLCSRIQYLQVRKLKQMKIHRIVIILSAKNCYKWMSLTKWKPFSQNIYKDLQKDCLNRSIKCLKRAKHKNST